MWRVTWRNLFARKLRLLLSAFAIVLGVAFVAGTMIFTNAMGGAFDDIIEGSTADVEVAYKGANDFDSGQDNRTFPASVVADLEALPEVASGQPAEHPPDRLRDRQGRQGDRRQRPARPGRQPHRRRVAHRQADPQLTEGDYPTRAGPDRPRRRHRREGRLRDRRQGRAGHPGPPADDEGQAHRAGRVRVGRPERRHPDGLRHARSCRSGSSAARTSTPSSPSTRPTASPSSELAKAAQKVLPAGRRRADRRRLRREEQGEPRRDPRLPADLPAGLRRGLPVRRDLHHHQHLLDPGRPAQPGARAAARHGRLAPAGQPVGARSRRSRSGCVGSTVGLGVGYLLALGLRWLFGVFGLDLSRADFPMTWSAVIWSYVVGRGRHRRSRRCSPRAAPPGSPRSRRCATTWPCPSRRCGAAVLIGTVLVLVGAGAHGARADG